MTLTEKQAIARAFSRAAPSYDAAAQVQRAVARNLAEQILALPIAKSPGQCLRILEIGCGTGFLGAILRPELPGAEWYFTDIAEGMVARSRKVLGGFTEANFLVMDGEAPCFAPPTLFDIICSSLAGQWFADPAATCHQLVALLKPGGYLALSTLIADSFLEWRQLAEKSGVDFGIRDYPDLGAWRSFLPSDCEHVVRDERHVVSYRNGHEFLGDLKAIGAGHPRADYRAMAPGTLRRLLRATEQGFGATYHVAFICARRPILVDPGSN